MNVSEGNIILIPKGTRVWMEARYGPQKERKQPQDHVALVKYVRDTRMVGWRVGGLNREAAVADVELLDAGNHTLEVGKRRILGGSPIRGMGNIYATDGWCACGDEYVKRPDAEDVRQCHREHVLRIAEQARAMA